MAELDAILEKFTNPTTGSIHGASFIAIDRYGTDIYRKSFGFQRVDTNDSPALTLDTILWIASLTKLTSTVAVMQIVERGLIGLDDDVREIIPRFKELKVLSGFEGEDEQGKPILEDVKGPITLRLLMSHTSGFCYDRRNPMLTKYSSYMDRQEDMFSGTMEGNFHPLVFQPGTSWKYGPGLDWAAQVVSILTGMDFHEYQQKYIWQPLETHNTTFFPTKSGKTRADLQETGHRAPEAGSQNLRAGPSSWKLDCRDALGGGGLFSTPNDYSKLLGALITGGGLVLSKDSVDEMFRPQIGPGPISGLREFIIGTGIENTQALTWTQPGQEWSDMMELQHCLCGVINTEDVQGRRRKNTVHWSGMPNLIWLIDRESGVAAALFTQIMPANDIPCRDLVFELEKALYKIVNNANA